MFLLENGCHPKENCQSPVIVSRRMEAQHLPWLPLGKGWGVRREGILLANSSGTPSSDLTGCRATFPTERTTQYSFKTRSCQEEEWLGRMMQRTGAVTRYWLCMLSQ